MLAQLDRADLTIDDRFHFHFALGKALEDAGDYAASFEHYAEGNRLRRSVIAYDAEQMTERVRQIEEAVHARVPDRAQGLGRPAPDPIFIVGLPRAGSTLLEQILSSHSAVEGTMELPDIGAMRRTLAAARSAARSPPIPRCLRRSAPTNFAHSASVTSSRPASSARPAAPYFIDKMPNNWAHAGLIHLILPNAKIIDARRHPMSCCFSVFKQHFARGQRFSMTSTSSAATTGTTWTDGTLRRGAAGPRPPGGLRTHGRGHGSRGPPAARLLRPAVRGSLPALLRERAGRADGELRSRSASRSTATLSSNGPITRPGWARSSRRWARPSQT